MKKKLILMSLVAISAVAAVVGCSNPEGKVKYGDLVFDKEITAQFDTLTSEQMWGGTAIIRVIGDKLFAVAYEPGETTSWLHVFDKTGTEIKDLIPLGRGPEDAAMINAAQVCGSKLVLFDPQVYKELTVQEVPETESFRIEETVKEREKWVWNISLTDDKEIVYYSPGPKSEEGISTRIALKNLDGELIDELEVSPFADDDPMIRFTLEAMRSSFALSENGKHYAISYSDAGVLQMFTISDRISKSFTGLYYPHSMTMKGNQISSPDKSRPFINSMYASDSYLFASFDGEPYRRGENRLLYNKIAVFDWKGRSRLLINCDYRVEALCYDKPEDTIYAVIVDESGIYRLGKMKISL